MGTHSPYWHCPILPQSHTLAQRRAAYRRWVRDKRGIPGKPTCYDLSPIIEFLGEDSDLSLAKIIGCSNWSIMNLRRILGIPTRRNPRSLSRATLDAIRPFLGTASDVKIARRFACGIHQIEDMRKRYHIPAWQRQDRCYSPIEGMIAKQMTDNEIASALGKTLAQVKDAKRNRGISITWKYCVCGTRFRLSAKAQRHCSDFCLQVWSDTITSANSCDPDARLLFFWLKIFNIEIQSRTGHSVRSFRQYRCRQWDRKPIAPRVFRRREARQASFHP